MIIITELTSIIAALFILPRTLSLRKKTLAFIFYFLFFSASYEYAGISPILINWIKEGLIFFVFIEVVLQRRLTKFKTPGLLIFLALIISYLISALLESSSLLTSIYFARYIILGYCFFIAVCNMTITDEMIRDIFYLLVLFILIQIGISIIKFATFGITESYIGTMTVHSGTIGTLVPLVIVIYFLCLYFQFDHKIKYLWISLGSLLIAFSSAKRAFWFIVPFYFLLIIQNRRKKSLQSFRFFPKIYEVIIAGLFAMVIIYLGGRLLPSLNPEGRIGGTFNINYMLNYINNYNFESRNEQSFGRAASFVTIYERFKHESTLRQLFGYGTGIIKGYARGDGRLESFGIYGAITGFTFYLIQVGYIGSFLLFFFYLFLTIRLIRSFKKEKDAFWKSMILGTIFFSFLFYVDFFFYSVSFVHNYLISISFFFFTAISLRRSNIRSD